MRSDSSCGRVQQSDHQIGHFCRGPALVEMALNPHTGALTLLAAQQRIGEPVGDRDREAGDVTGSQHGARVPHTLPDPIDIERDDRPPTGHGLEWNQRHSLRSRRDDDDICGQVRIHRVVHRSEPGD